MIAELELSRPVTVVQFFWNAVGVNKKLWRDGSWRALSEWPDEIESNSGWLSKGRLVLNESALEHLDRIASTDVIVVRDTGSYSLRPPFPSRSPHPYFEFRPESEQQGVMRLTSRLSWYDFLSYENGARFDGYSLVREQGYLSLLQNDDLGARSFAIAKLGSGVAVRILSNARHDSSEPLHRDDRYYLSFDEVLVNLGEAHAIEVRPWSEVSSTKRVPLAEAKLVDRRKVLY